MNIHGIEYDSMLNGYGIRCVLWVSGCEHHCKGCQNPQTHDPNSGREMVVDDLLDIMCYLEKDYVSGLTLSGGDPLHPENRKTVEFILNAVKNRVHNKNIWLYTGYDFNTIKDLKLIENVDVVVDGKFVQELADPETHWRGSTNQRIWKKENGVWREMDEY